MMARDAHYFLFQDSYVCVPHKCGTTSLRMALFTIHSPDARFPASSREFCAWSRARGLGPVTASEAMSTGLPSFMAARPPIDRFMSLWRSWCRDGREPAYAGLSTEQLAVVVSGDLFGNRHWAPQARLWLPGVTVIRHDTVSARFTLPATPLNVTRIHPGDPTLAAETIARLEEIYQCDTALLEGAE